MKIQQLTIALLVAAAAQAPATAQQKQNDTLLRNNTIEVIQTYRPEVKQAPKPEFAPALPPVDTARPRQTYNVPAQTLYFTYHSQPLKPLALGKDTADLPFANYIKLGGGNLSTILLDAGIGSLRGENYNSAIHLHHLSQSGEIVNQKTALTGLEAGGSVSSEKLVYHAGVDIKRNQYAYYGYDHDKYKYTADSVKQVFTGVRIALGLENKHEAYALSYQPTVKLGIYSDKYDNTERTLHVYLPLSQQVDSNFSYSIGLRGNVAAIRHNSYSSDNVQLQLTPSIQYRKGIFDGRAGLNPTLSSNSTTHLLPDIAIGIKLPKTGFSINVGWQESLRQNTFEFLTTRNPWFAAQTGGFKETQTYKKEIYAGIQSNIGSHFDFSGRFSVLEWNDLPVFLNDAGDGKLFYAANNSLVKAYGIQANIRYQVANIFSLGLSGTVLNYYETTLPKVWNEPGLQLRADLLYRPLPALTLTAYSMVLDQMYNHNILNNTVKTQGILDIGLGGEYSFVERLSAFVNVNNLLNNKYERWPGYASYGFNIFGGLRLKF